MDTALRCRAWNSTHLSKEMTDFVQDVAWVSLSYLSLSVAISDNETRVTFSLFHGLDCSWRSEEISSGGATAGKTWSNFTVSGRGKTNTFWNQWKRSAFEARAIRVEIQMLQGNLRRMTILPNELQKELKSVFKIKVPHIQRRKHTWLNRIACELKTTALF